MNYLVNNNNNNKLPYLIVCFILLINLSQSATQCNDQIKYGEVTTTWNSVQMTVCMSKSEIIKNCQLYQSLISTSADDLVTFQQLQCIQRPDNTFLASLMQGGYAYVPYSQRVNYCLRYRNIDNSFTTFICAQCEYQYRINGLNRCTQKITGCIVYDKYGVCIECDNGQYQLIGGLCTPAILQSLDPNCQRSNRQGKCILCKEHFILAGDLCYHATQQKATIDLLLGQCKDNEIRTPLGKCIPQMKHCAKYDQQTELCLYCQKGYKFNDQLTQCIIANIQQLNIDSICPKPSSQRTIYKLLNNKCIQVDRYCVDNPPMQSGCVNCEKGYFSYGGRCYFIFSVENNN